MNYLAFTDEAGSWSDENSGVYVRSFVLFEEDAYLRLAGGGEVVRILGDR